MSMKNLVSEECGGPNPLMQLANKVHEGNLQHREIGIHHQLENDSSLLEEREDVVPIHQTFDMQSLLKEMTDIRRPPGMANIDLLSNHTAKTWEKEYFAIKNEPVETNDEDILNFPQTHVIPVNRAPQFYMPPPFLTRTPLQDNGTMKWAHEYLDDNVEILNQSSGTQKTAQEIIESFENEEIKREEIKNNMKNDLAEQWVHEYENTGSEDVLDLREGIAKEIENDVEYWQQLQKDWNELFSEDQFQNEQDAALTGYENHYHQEYSLEKDNPFTGFEGAFEKGIEKLNEGDLISAVLLFEEAVRVNPDHAEAWQYLGTSQAENEQEMLAIQALNKCIELQPGNLTARMSIAVSYTNEYLQSPACEALKSWIQYNPIYSHLIHNTDSNFKSNVGSSFMSNAVFEELKNLYMSAAQLSPQGDIDAEVQVGLGVLFNLAGEYEKAIDCFNAGIQANPDNATLWNKLGATLANGGRSAEAIAAYRNALERRPGFIRCRYNLGISCVNMKAYHEAVEHFLSALNMQRKGEDPSRSASTMSENIWSTLRMSISMLGRLDLMKVVDKRDLEVLNNEFKIHEL